MFLPLPEDEEEVILGRATEGQSMVPDINLEPYQAFEAGVSRIHAAIRIAGDQVLITDLGSGNGTRINGNKIEPQIPHPIANGDLVNLGKLKIQIIIKNQNQVKKHFSGGPSGSYISGAYFKFRSGGGGGRRAADCEFVH